ncbi:DeoR family transcriptional regulator [Martelella lutilitoris]|uniref:DeoR family transcriptional regulator n=1 Tax=Martelella lutilitoris TaxID=2583532 RepID=A0A7T7HGX0_9HYPH|nr:DeoR family transcriptional regulator [Martelella lutilitoris]QQM28988.1 DeoR family transcriptional regulator [Martelella lutilitoris]
MLQKKGRRLPIWKGVLGGREVYAQTVAELLRKEHGDSHRAVKQLMRQTDASERTVKHWLSGQHGPDTVYFLRLVVSSPVIRAFVIGLIEGPASRRIPDPVDRYSLATAKDAYAVGEAALDPSNRRNPQNDPENDPDCDPINVPETIELNERQHWFLARIGEGGRCGATEIMATWKVSLKTARRDIRGLQQANLLVYVGSRRKGRYRPTQR